jgi:phosphohistidine phosphatase SixA
MFNKLNIFIIVSIIVIYTILIGGGGYGYGLLSYKNNLFPINLLKKKDNLLKKKDNKNNNFSKNFYWVNEIKKGGYILHIRHAEREKWDTTVAHDVIELLNNLDGRNMSFAKAVCLTEKGIEDAKLIGEVFKVLNIPVGHVVSSPSCRARETAIFAFERIDRIEPSLLHRTAMREDQHILMGNKIREVVENIKIEDGKNIILSGHGGTLSNDFKNKVGIIDETEVDDIDERLETGIIVIEQKKNKYIARHKFNSINDISVNSIKLTIDDISKDKFLWQKKNHTP